MKIKIKPQNLWDPIKLIFKEKFTALNVCIRKDQKSKTQRSGVYTQMRKGILNNIQSKYKAKK